MSLLVLDLLGVLTRVPGRGLGMSLLHCATIL